MRLISTFLITVLLISCGRSTKLDERLNQEIELDIQIEKLNSPVETSLRGISVLSEDLAWLSGAKGSIVRTVNGGKTWSLIPPPDNDSLDFRSIYAFSANSAIIASAGFPDRVYKTNNAGVSWNLVYENEDSAAFINSIAFKNENLGIIMGDQLKGRHLIFRTSNGGDSWTRIDSNDVPKPFAVENAFAASGSCIAISRSGRFFIGFGGENSRVFSSINGLMWKAKSTPMMHGCSSCGIYSIASSGNGEIMAVGGDYTKPDSSHYPIVSLNDGKSWVRTTGRANGYRSVIDYSNKIDSWLSAGSNGIDLSYDHGVTWEKIGENNVNTLQFAPNSSVAFLGTKDGELLKMQILLNESDK